MKIEIEISEENIKQMMITAAMAAIESTVANEVKYIVAVDPNFRAMMNDAIKEEIIKASRAFAERYAEDLDSLREAVQGTIRKKMVGRIISNIFSREECLDKEMA